MSGKNKGGREARKPKKEQNKKIKGRRRRLQASRPQSCHLHHMDRDDRGFRARLAASDRHPTMTARPHA